MKGDRPSFAVGQERYVDGKWLDITYGRPSLRGRDVFGSGANYGKALIDLAARRLGAAAGLARRRERLDAAQHRGDAHRSATRRSRRANTACSST